MPERGKYQKLDTDPPIMIPLRRYPAGYLFAYSNSDYNLLGHLVSSVSGMNLGDYITKIILKPLEMNDSIAPKTMKGSAGMECSIDDMANYIMMLLRIGDFKGYKIISRTLFDEMFKPSIGMPPVKNKKFRGICWRVWTIHNRLYSFNHAFLSQMPWI